MPVAHGRLAAGGHQQRRRGIRPAAGAARGRGCGVVPRGPSADRSPSRRPRRRRRRNRRGARRGAPRSPRSRARCRRARRRGSRRTTARPRGCSPRRASARRGCRRAPADSPAKRSAVVRADGCELRADRSSRSAPRSRAFRGVAAAGTCARRGRARRRDQASEHLQVRALRVGRRGMLVDRARTRRRATERAVARCAARRRCGRGEDRRRHAGPGSWS